MKRNREFLLFLTSPILGFIAVMWPSLIMHGKQYDAPLFPAVRTAVENISLVALISLFACGLILGITNSRRPFLLGMASMAIFPLLAIIEMFVSSSSHNLWPLEFAFYAFYAILVVAGVFTSILLRKLWTRRELGKIPL